ncbi:MAG: hypothetical protein HY321_13650 [Armatimonadetes bacterium]|nr:hypothetical protein [Armatimonadota bacterium]
MSYGTSSWHFEVGESDFDLGRALEWVFGLGFAREQIQQSQVEQRQALEDCGRVLPWVTVIAVLVWAQVYSLGFIGILAFLEVQALVIGLVTAAFVPNRSAATALNIVVNVFLGLLVTFLVLFLGAFLLGFGLLILSEAE